MGLGGKALFKALYRWAGTSPNVFRTTFRIYANDAKAMYANPDLKEIVERSLPDFQRLDLDAMIQYFAVMPDIDITSLLTQIQAPTLTITGDCDPIVSPGESRKIASMTPNAELAMIKGAGHLPFLERPVEYQTTLSEWLKKTR
jgi:pimeloyl-ACP methyl ester carboxylesterase